MKSAFHKAVFYVNAQLGELIGLMPRDERFTYIMSQHEGAPASFVGVIRFLLKEHMSIVFFSYRDGKFVPDVKGKIQAKPANKRNFKFGPKRKEGELIIPLGAMFETNYGWFQAIDNTTLEMWPIGVLKLGPPYYKEIEIYTGQTKKQLEHQYYMAGVKCEFIPTPGELSPTQQQI